MIERKENVAQIDDAARNRAEMAEKAHRVAARISHSGAQPWSMPSTIDEPATMNMNGSTAVTTKAMTWFFVIAETQAPRASIAPAISQLPR